MQPTLQHKGFKVGDKVHYIKESYGELTIIAIDELTDEVKLALPNLNVKLRPYMFWSDITKIFPID